MRGVYTRQRKGSTSMYCTYSPPGESYVREWVETVKRGPNFDSELKLALHRAGLVLHKRRGEIVEGRYQLAPSRTMTVSDFVAKYYGAELKERRGGAMRGAAKEITRLTTGPLGKAFGSTRLAELTEWRIRKYIKQRRESGVGPATVNRDLARLSNC